jgi:hypothetical protein
VEPVKMMLISATINAKGSSSADIFVDCLVMLETVGLAITLVKSNASTLNAPKNADFQ